MDKTVSDKTTQNRKSRTGAAARWAGVFAFALWALLSVRPIRSDGVDDTLPDPAEMAASPTDTANGTAPRHGLPGRIVESFLPESQFDENFDSLDTDAESEAFDPSEQKPLDAESSAESSAQMDDEIGFQRITPAAAGQPVGLSAIETAWGRFAPGSWTRTRTIGTTIQRGKNFKSVTETKLTLMEVQADGYLLKREVSIRMGIRNHTKDPEYVKYNFYGLPSDSSVTESSLPPVNLQLSRKVIPCQARLFEKISSQWKDQTTICYSSVLTPFVFQRETKTFSIPTEQAPEEKLIRHSKTTIQRSGVNFRLGNDLTTWRSQTVEQKSDSVSLTKTFHSIRIPGELLRESTVETDSDGNVVYQSSTVLLDYFAK